MTKYSYIRKRKQKSNKEHDFCNNDVNLNKNLTFFNETFKKIDFKKTCLEVKAKILYFKNKVIKQFFCRVNFFLKMLFAEKMLLKKLQTTQN